MAPNKPKNKSKSNGKSNVLENPEKPIEKVWHIKIGLEIFSSSKILYLIKIRSLNLFRKSPKRFSQQRRSKMKR